AGGHRAACSAGLRLNGEKPPPPSYAFESVRSAISKSKPRSGHEIPDGAGDQDFAGAGTRRYTRPDVYSDPGNLLSRNLALAGVQAGANCQSQHCRRVPNGTRAPYRACRPIETGEHSVASGVDDSTPETGRLRTNVFVKAVQQVPPSCIAHRRQSFR